MRPVEASQARPRPSAAMCGRWSGPWRRPARSPRPCGAGLRDMPDRVGAGIAIGVRILRAADTDGIEHDEKSARHAVKILQRHEDHD